MKKRITLLAITLVAMLAMGLILGGCGCSNNNAPTAPADPATHAGNGENYVADEFGTAIPTKKTVDKNGNTIITYTNDDGNKVTKTIDKKGNVTVVVKDKKGKVVETKKYKEKVTEPAKSETKKVEKKTKKTEKKTKKAEDKTKKKGGTQDGWSDFY